MAGIPPAPVSGPEDHSKNLDAIIAQRRETLKRLSERGVQAYPYTFARSHRVTELLKEFDRSPLAWQGPGRAPR